MGRMPRQQCGECTRTATPAQMQVWGWHRSSDGSVWCREHAHIGAARDQAGTGSIPATAELPPVAANHGPAASFVKALAQRPWAWGVGAGALALVMLCCCGGVLTVLVTGDTSGSGRESADAQATPPALIAQSATANPGGDEVSGTSGAGGTGQPTPTANRPETATVVVTNVIDGDTVDVSTGDRVRLIGIDTPERGECGYDQATANLASLVSGKEVTLVSGARDDKDHYGRLLRYIQVGNIDVGLEQIKAGYAIARYDSRDGYGAHPREQSYIAADNASPNYACPDPPQPTTQAPPVQAPPPPPPPPPPAQPKQSNCHPSYVPCVPDVPYDLDCADIGFPVTVIGPDEYRLDNNDPDNIGCESYG